MMENMEDELKDLYESYVDACSMCTHLECDNCYLRMVIDDLEEILKTSNRKE